MILWDEKKNIKLIKERGVSFEVFADLILNRQYYEILENPSRKNQFIAIVSYDKYTYIVPFVLDEAENIVLKTIFPSRKYHKIYGGFRHARK
jgi:uncharacterized DUF497 family protein